MGVHKQQQNKTGCVKMWNACTVIWDTAMVRQVVDPHGPRIPRPATFSIRKHLNTAYHFSCLIKYKFSRNHKIYSH